MAGRSALLAVLLLCGALPAAAQPTIFVVRHAERADAVAGVAPTMSDDPGLSDAGRRRAEGLSAVLRDAGITVIYATEFRRTRQTAAPLAAALGLEVTTVPSNDDGALVAALRRATGNVLVVGHSNTVPGVIRALGVDTPVTVGDADYDNLFVVTLGEGPRLLRLHYR